MRIGVCRTVVEQERAGQIGAMSNAPLQMARKAPSTHWQKHPARAVDGIAAMAKTPISKAAFTRLPI